MYAIMRSASDCRILREPMLIHFATGIADYFTSSENPHVDDLMRTVQALKEDTDRDVRHFAGAFSTQPDEKLHPNNITPSDLATTGAGQAFIQTMQCYYYYYTSEIFLKKKIVNETREFFFLKKL